jgi:hypothetical protein
MQRVRVDVRSADAANGRDGCGRFSTGNKFALGNGVARKAARFRNKLFATISTKDFCRVVRRVLKEAIAGEAWACRLLLPHLIGRPLEYDIIAQAEGMAQELIELKKAQLNRS